MYPGSVVELDCIDSISLPSFVLLYSIFIYSLPTGKFCMPNVSDFLQNQLF